VRRYRRVYGTDLKTAKDALDAVEHEWSTKPGA
jgi:hypothetical protein